MANHAGSAWSGSKVVAILLTVGITVSPIAMAEWEGVPTDDYWWPYNLYLALLWILPIGYGLMS